MQGERLGVSLPFDGVGIEPPQAEQLEIIHPASLGIGDPHAFKCIVEKGLVGEEGGYSVLGAQAAGCPAFPQGWGDYWVAQD